MSVLIETLARQLQSATHNLRLAVHAGTEELLVEVHLADRKQSVSVSMAGCKAAKATTIRMLSRCGPIKDHRTVRAALITNANMELGGLCLDTTTNPPVLDVIYHMVYENHQFEDFLMSLYSVAKYADQLEQKLVGGDNF